MKLWLGLGQLTRHLKPLGVFVGFLLLTCVGYWHASVSLPYSEVELAAGYRKSIFLVGLFSLLFYARALAHRKVNTSSAIRYVLWAMVVWIVSFVVGSL